MKKIALTVGAVLALSLGMAPVALAQDDDSCDAAKKALAKLEVKLDTAVFDERSKEQPALDAAQAAFDVAKGELDRRKGLLDAAKLANDAAEIARLEPLVESAKKARDAAKVTLADAQKKFDTDNPKVAGLRAQVELAIQERDKACDEAPPTTTTPVPTTPADADVDCDEVSDARAQEILDADRNDPNNLDDDNDGVACEEEVVVADNSDVVVTPSGGVNTGGWRK